MDYVITGIIVFASICFLTYEIADMVARKRVKEYSDEIQEVVKKIILFDDSVNRTLKIMNDEINRLNTKNLNSKSNIERCQACYKKDKLN